MFVVCCPLALHSRTVGRGKIPAEFSLPERIHTYACPVLCSTVLLQEHAAEQHVVQPGMLCITCWVRCGKLLPYQYFIYCCYKWVDSHLKCSVKAAFSQSVEVGKHFCLSKIHVSGYSQCALHSILLYFRSALLQKKCITCCLLSRCIISCQRGYFLSAEK